MNAESRPKAASDRGLSPCGLRLVRFGWCAWRGRNQPLSGTEPILDKNRAHCGIVQALIVAHFSACGFVSDDRGRSRA